MEKDGGSQWVMMGHDKMLIPIVCQIMHLVATKEIQFRTVYEMAFDLSDVNFHQMYHTPVDQWPLGMFR